MLLETISTTAKIKQWKDIHKNNFNKSNFYYVVSFKTWDYLFPQLAFPDKHKEQQRYLGRESQRTVQDEKLFAWKSSQG